MREVGATLEKRKPYTFVHESDAAKGGAELATLKRELQDPVVRFELFDSRRIIEWHRVQVCVCVCMCACVRVPGSGFAKETN